MAYEIQLNGRTARVEIISREENKVYVRVDGKEYQLDYVKVSPDRISILYRNKSFTMELVAGSDARSYLVNTFNRSFPVQILDAESRYLTSRRKGQQQEAAGVITAPIPGRVVKIMVSEGEQVEAGQTLIVVSAMKMESDFKAPREGKVARISVSEGQTVEARQELIVME